MTRLQMRFPVQIRPLVTPFLHRLFAQTASPYRFIVPDRPLGQLLLKIFEECTQRGSVKVSRHSRPSVPVARCLGR